MTSGILQKIRYQAGRLTCLALDAAMGPGSPFRHVRIPTGWHFHRDVRCFLGRSPRTIFDVGVHHGRTVEAFHRHFPKAAIHAFEPVARNFSELHSRCRRWENVTCNQLGCGDCDGVMTAVLSNDSECTSLNGTVVQPSGRLEELPIVRLDGYCQRKGLESICLLKIDVEGFEIPVLRGLGAMIENGRIPMVYAEAGFVRSHTDKTHFSMLDDLLTPLGYLSSGFYEPLRWGPNKRWLSFANALWTHRTAQNGDDSNHSSRPI